MKGLTVLRAAWRALMPPAPVEAPVSQIRTSCLPAIAAVTAVAAISAAPASVTTPTPTASAAPAAITAAPASTAALCLRTRLVDHQVSSAEILPVQGINCAIRIFVAVDFDEGESARLTRETVSNEIHTGWGYTHLRKPLLKLLFRCRKRKITDIELLHLLLLLPGT